MPRSRPNSRVRDLPDLALLATTKVLEAVQVREALAQTFAFRGTHAVPDSLPDPPPSWAEPHAAMAVSDRLAWATLRDVVAAVRAFLDPVLAGVADTVWQPTSWNWMPC